MACVSFDPTASSMELCGGCVLWPGPNLQSPWLLAGPYPIWICPEYMVRSSMMVKPVKRPRF